MIRPVLNVFFISFAVFLLWPSISDAGSQKIVLLEEATNAYCAPCATLNPGLQQMYATHFGGLVSVRYHAWWPGSADPMFQSNTQDNYDRIVYYAVSGVPTYMIDGVYQGNPNNPAKIESEMYERLTHLSPAQIDIHYEQDYDSVKTTVTLKALQTLNVDSLFLRIAIIERHIVYAFPPGNNGETEFGAVMRKMLPDAKGTFLGHLTAGDSLSLSFTLPLQIDWNPDDLAVVAWLQNDLTKEILQANIDFPTFILQEKESHIQILQPDISALKEYYIANDNEESLHLSIELRNIQKPEDWQFNLVFPENKGPQSRYEIPAGDTLRFYLEVHTSQRGSAKADIFALNLSDPGFYGEGYGYGFIRTFNAIIADNNEVLVVDDDGDLSFQDNFEDILNDLNVRSLTVAQQDLSYFNFNVDLDKYRTLIWNCSAARPAFTEEDIIILKDYLDNGGNFLLFGQDIGADIFEDDGKSIFDGAKTFYKDYLGTTYLEDNTGGLSIAGVEGDTISDGISFALDTPYGFENNRPEGIAADSGKSIPIFYYNNNKTAALRFDNGNFKTIYFGFGLEQIKGADKQQKILKRSLAWAGNVTGLEEQDQRQPENIILYKNYPNPFNPQTDISVFLHQPAQMRITVYDVLGRQVKKIFAGYRKAGMHTFLWRGKSDAGKHVSSGLYFYRLQSEGRILHNKMLLIR